MTTAIEIKDKEGTRQTQKLHRSRTHNAYEDNINKPSECGDLHLLRQNYGTKNSKADTSDKVHIWNNPTGTRHIFDISVDISTHTFHRTVQTGQTANLPVPSDAENCRYVGA